MICGNTAGSGPSMFANYRFVQPHTSRNVRIVGLSYLWAGLLGPVYVLFKSGPRKLPHSIVLSLACAAVFIAFVIKGLAYVPETLQIVSLVFAADRVHLPLGQDDRPRARELPSAQLDVPAGLLIRPTCLGFP
jgi:hypothetical protein